MNIAILGSGTGRTAERLIQALATQSGAHKICLILSNKPGSGLLQRAARHQIPHRLIGQTTHRDAASRDLALCAALEESAADIVLLLGYLQLIGPEVLRRFAGRIVNSHPALLPKFGGKGMFGLHVHREVLRCREPISGATLHHVDGSYDTGAIILQTAITIPDGCTPEALADAIRDCEVNLLTYYFGDSAQNSPAHRDAVRGGVLCTVTEILSPKYASRCGRF